MGRYDYLVVAHGLECLEALDALFDAFGAVVYLRHKMAVHIGTQGSEYRAGFVFLFEQVKHRSLL
jgi:hypothetical protein